MGVDHEVVVSLGQAVLFTRQVDTERVEADHVLNWVVEQAERVLLGDPRSRFPKDALEDLERLALALGHDIFERVVQEHVQEFAHVDRSHGFGSVSAHMLILRLFEHVILNGAVAANFFDGLALDLAVLLRVFNHLLDVLQRENTFLFDQLASLTAQFGLELADLDLGPALDDHHHAEEILPIELSIRDLQLAFRSLISQ